MNNELPENCISLLSSLPINHPPTHTPFQNEDQRDPHSTWACLLKLLDLEVVTKDRHPQHSPVWGTPHLP